MNWIKKTILSFVQKTKDRFKKDRPTKEAQEQSLWINCPDCNQMQLKEDLRNNYNICKCSHHFDLDPKIRFENPKQELLWKKNVKALVDAGVTVKLFISVTKDTLAIEPIKLLKWVKALGVQEMALERLTGNGNALLHPEIFPKNIDQDAWFLEMHKQSEEYGARDWFENEFLETIYDKFEKNFNKGGTFCRDCEEKLYTINADGTLSGCPNAAPEEQFGHINDDIKSLINSPKRIKNIACERARDPRCFQCPVFAFCGGDCHQLEWQGDICGAPKSLMKFLKAEKHGDNR